MPRLIIQNGRLIDPAAGLDTRADLVLEGGKVAAVHPASDGDAPPAPTPGRDPTPGDPGSDDLVLDATGLIVSPGLIDPHVHFREPGGEDKETIATGCASAVAGGFTTVCVMPNTTPALDDDGRVEFVHRQAEKAGLCHVFVVGAATKGRRGEELAEIGLMAKAGAVAFSDDGQAVASAAVMAKALAYVAMTGKVFMQHCEDPELGGGAMNAGTLATKLGLPGWPRVAEELTLQRDLQLCQSMNYACRYHAQHMTTARGVEILRRAQQDAADAGFHDVLTGEASPHHLLLTEDACANYDTHAKMNPPLRQAADVDALKAGLADGTITVLATDHAPHTAEEKALEFAAAPYGIVGLDCALPLYVKALVEPGVIGWPKLLELLTINPARLCGLDNKGTLAVGSDADVTLIDPDVDWTLDVEQFASQGRNCPFDGWPVRGRAVATIVDSQIKHRAPGFPEPAAR
ncbi:MAG: dihydroorotase [Planctomycetota bacterium]